MMYLFFVFYSIKNHAAHGMCSIRGVQPTADKLSFIRGVQPPADELSPIRGSVWYEWPITLSIEIESKYGGMPCEHKSGEQEQGEILHATPCIERWT
jgi:hypothetical protein